MNKNYTQNLKESKNKIFHEIKSLFKDEKSGHDIEHLKRVYKTALKIQKIEGGDLYVVAISALVHDVHRLMSNEAKRFVPPKDSLQKVESILLKCNCDKNKIDQILEVVKYHDNKNKKDCPIEVLIVQDADTLDAIGKIGLKRTLTYCKAHNIPISNRNIPLNCDEYMPDVNPISTCHYIYNTMVPNGENLFTQTAKKLAKNKINALKHFVNKQLQTKVY